MKRNIYVNKLITAIQAADPTTIQYTCEELRTWLLKKEFTIKITSFQLLVLTEVMKTYAQNSQKIDQILKPLNGE